MRRSPWKGRVRSHTKKQDSARRKVVESSLEANRVEMKNNMETHPKNKDNKMPKKVIQRFWNGQEVKKQNNVE